MFDAVIISSFCGYLIEVKELLNLWEGYLALTGT